MRLFLKEMSTQELCEWMNTAACKATCEELTILMENCGRLYVDKVHYEDEYGRILSLMRKELESRGIAGKVITDLSVGETLWLMDGEYTVTAQHSNLCRIRSWTELSGSALRTVSHYPVLPRVYVA